MTCISASSTQPTPALFVVEDRDMEDCYQSGVNSYIAKPISVKPISIAQVKRDIQTLVGYCFEVTTLSHCSEG